VEITNEMLQHAMDLLTIGDLRRTAEQQSDAIAYLQGRNRQLLREQNDLLTQLADELAENGKAQEQIKQMAERIGRLEEENDFHQDHLRTAQQRASELEADLLSSDLAQMRWITRANDAEIINADLTAQVQRLQASLVAAEKELETAKNEAAYWKGEAQFWESRRDFWADSANKLLVRQNAISRILEN
jgi:chromosome segregation ATPase